MSVRWWCSACEAPLRLENTLWKSEGGDYRCNVGGVPVTEGGKVVHVERVSHRPANDWVHPALREGAPDVDAA